MTCMRDRLGYVFLDRASSAVVGVLSDGSSVLMGRFLLLPMMIDRFLDGIVGQLDPREQSPHGTLSARDGVLQIAQIRVH